MSRLWPGAAAGLVYGAAMILAWLAHAYTATGAVLALLAVGAVMAGNYRAAFLWLALQIAVDATDGWLARAARVSERLPWFDGAKLDDIIDYLTYAFVPALIVWHVPLVPEPLALPVAAAIVLASAFGFNRADAKTSDHFFTGFPSYWNIVALYLVAAGWSPWTNAVVLAVLVVLVFVPLRYVYPTRTPVLQWLTLTVGGIWGGLMLGLIWMLPDVPRLLFWGSLVFPVYYTGLSLTLHWRQARTASAVSHP
jgi:phosphatidylcholine synthase